MDFTSIPLTSHSAPVDEYIVLWTADKYKKLKKWHDGYLRYHTFNKRLMVYDHLMNKVCDKFLPEPEPIDVGDELVFDSHLITIEDVKGRQAQDLRPLFEKTVDRRRERASTATPIRTPGTPGPAGQSPTPTLLRGIQSRPSTGHGRPVYPSPAPRVTPAESPQPNVVVPQKRTSQGVPVVQKINYKPFKVSRVKDAEPPPARPTNRSRNSVIRYGNEAKDTETEVPPDLDLATNVLDADSNVEMLELDLEGADFAPRPKPSTRVRPNAPPPFRPPRPQVTFRNEVPQEPEDETTALPKPSVPAVVPMSQTTNLPRSSPRIPPSTLTNYSQDPLSSPSFRDRPKKPPTRVQPSSPKSVAILAKSPSQSPSPDSPSEEELEPPKRLSLPSAASRNRRKLLCGPSGRQNGVSKMIYLARPVSTLSILDAFPTDNGPSELLRPGKSKGVLSKAESSEYPKIKAPKRQVIKQAGSAVSKAPVRSNTSQAQNNIKQDSHWKPVWNHDDKPTESASPEVETPLNTGDKEAKVSESALLIKRNKSQNKASGLCIFSSDEEELEDLGSKPAPKRSKSAVSSDSEFSSDDFEPLRSSAVPKHLVGQSRATKLQSRQAVSEASRVWREATGSE